ncbi:MAG: mandelate racemase/muconate lactonizing enzyme family protein [Alistipes sp.]|jgi:L-alanine-DL-glutamate epimerase-like enolase superfamily enzyme|nr:mandelate racemase/muconate lactonizing enzyme family protein [Alistipes sp.]
MKRRDFLATTLAGGASLAAFPWLGLQTADAQRPQTVRPVDSPEFSSDELDARYALLDEVLARPVFRRDLFPEPVVVKSIELLERDGRYLCRVRSKRGAEGVAVCHPSTATFLPVMRDRIVPFFIGQDVRDLDALVEWVMMYRLNFRLGGMAIGLPLANVELALLDMMGRIAGVPAAGLIGGVRNPEVGLYYATELRELPLRKHFKRLVREVEQYDVTALKIKVGFMWEGNRDISYRGIPGKSEELIPLVRRHFGDGWTLYADANGYYTVDEAIRIGRLLEANSYGYFEEPVFFNRFEDIKRVSDALTIPVANGEQDQGFYNYRWLLAHDGLDIVEPDLYYFGGMIRSMRVAMMAHAMGKKCLTHMSGGGLGYVYNVQLVSALPNPVPHHEFKGLGTHVDFDCPTSPLSLTDGTMRAPTGPGLGITLSPAFVGLHKVI